MLTDNINNSYITLISLLSFIIFLLVLKIFSTNKYGFLRDEEFDKPQAFHENSIPRIGGLASIISLTFLFITFNYIFEFKNLEYVFFSISFFTLGFLDDLKISLKPSIRLLLMVFLMIIGLTLFDIKVTKTGFSFLNNLLEINIFQYVFLILCFLFVINGSNLTDGFNGLLTIHLIIINSILLFIYLNNQETINALFLTGQIFIMFCFLLFNFPSAKMFMGDGGAYLFGSITSINVIKVAENFSNISPLFFSVLLFYLFFEVFFSFVRKLLLGKSPLKPDSDHLHMLVYKKIKNTNKIKFNNPTTSILINSFFFVTILPAFIYRDNGLFCRYWFLILIIVYLYTYYKLTKIK